MHVCMCMWRIYIYIYYYTCTLYAILEKLYMNKHYISEINVYITRIDMQIHIYAYVVSSYICRYVYTNLYMIFIQCTVYNVYIIDITLQGTNISPQIGIFESMIFLFPFGGICDHSLEGIYIMYIMYPMKVTTITTPPPRQQPQPLGHGSQKSSKRTIGRGGMRMNRGSCGVGMEPPPLPFGGGGGGWFVVLYCIKYSKYIVRLQ